MIEHIETIIYALMAFLGFLMAWTVGLTLVPIYRYYFWANMSNKYQLLRARVFAKVDLDDRVEEDRVEQLLRREDPAFMEAYTKNYSFIDFISISIITVMLTPFGVIAGVVAAHFLLNLMKQMAS